LLLENYAKRAGPIGRVENFGACNPDRPMEAGFAGRACPNLPASSGAIRPGVTRMTVRGETAALVPLNAHQFLDLCTVALLIDPLVSLRR
jgi:hypothetical protein